MSRSARPSGPKPLPKPLESLTKEELAAKSKFARVTTETLLYLTGALTRRGFDWLLPVVLSQATDPLWPDPGASIETRVETEIYGKTVRTMQSMIIHKLVACSTAYPKLFVLSPNVRIEKRQRRATGWHTFEFTQLDFEIRNGTFEDVKGLVEESIAGLTVHLAKKGLLPRQGRNRRRRAPSLPFEVFDRSALLSKFGRDWEPRLSEEINDPVWVRNIPREFYDFEDPATGRWDNYDLFVPQYGEVLSGARREWQHARILEKMERDGVRRDAYSFLLELAKRGRLSPSAGAGLGIERVVGWLVGIGHIGDVQPFPKVPGVVYDL